MTSVTLGELSSYFRFDFGLPDAVVYESSVADRGDISSPLMIGFQARRSNPVLRSEVLDRFACKNEGRELSLIRRRVERGVFAARQRTVSCAGAEVLNVSFVWSLQGRRVRLMKRCARISSFAMMYGGHGLSCRTRNQQRAEEGEGCLPHFLLR